MKRIFVKAAFLILAIALAMLIEFAISHYSSHPRRNAESASGNGLSVPVLIIDAGHGGIDSGAVTDSGVRESDINLDIAQKLDLLMGFLGVRTILTRDTESISYSAGAVSIREKKLEDTRNRVNLVNSTPNAVLISIHQNKYTSEGPFGAQVLYAGTPGSGELAEHMQSLLISALNPKNYRAAVRIPSSIYLMNNVTCTAILVECGFLSNPGEISLLTTGEYRLKIAAVIAAGYLSSRLVEI